MALASVERGRFKTTTMQEFAQRAAAPSQKQESPARRCNPPAIGATSGGMASGSIGLGMGGGTWIWTEIRLQPIAEMALRGVHRVRPGMTSILFVSHTATCIRAWQRRANGLVPIMWSTGAGADVMKRIAAPMIGGLFTSFLMELFVYPAIYLLWRERDLPHPEPGDDERPKHHWWQRPELVSSLTGVVVALGIASYMFFPRSAAKALFPQYKSVAYRAAGNEPRGHSLITANRDATRTDSDQFVQVRMP